MAQQLCTPTRVFGGDFQQHLFLGCSVRSISSSIGWNEQQSQCDVELVQDPCEAPASHPKVYYDQNLNRKTTTAADPGFTAPNVGSPVYLRLEDFEFSGLIQSYERTDNDSGNPTYRVTLVDPRTILQGTQIIIGDYAGSVYNTTNVLNAYGFAESFGMRCPFRQVLGAYFGSPAGAFGGASLNDNGMPWNTIKDSVSILTSAIPYQTGIFASYGRLVYIGSQIPGYGSMKSDFINAETPILFPQISPYQTFYTLDISEIPNAPSYYRISGTNISLLDLISTVCEDAGCDYYVELLPVRMGGAIIKIIKVRVVVRGTQPDIGQIEEFVSAAGNVISKTIGHELRNEPTSNFIIGGQVDSIYQADEALLTEEGLLDDDDDIIVPYWGLDRFNNIIPTSYDTDGKLNFTVNITSLNSLLYQPLEIEAATITEYELQAALTGQDAWLAIASSLPSDLGEQLQLAGILDSKRILDTLNNVGFPHHLIVPGKKAGNGVVNFDDLKNESKKMKDIETIYNFVLNYARDFYGKKFIVRVPYTCSRIDDESLQTLSTESPTDSGWTETEDIIGLLNPDFTDLFKDDQGKIEPFARFDRAKDVIEISNVPEEDYILIEGETEDGEDDSTLFIRGQSILTDFVYEDYIRRFNPYAVIELASPILLRLEDEDLNRTKEFANKFFTVINNAKTALGIPGAVPNPNMNDILKNCGNSLLHLGITSEFKKPDAVAMPIRSNMLNYGPWVSRGPIGLTNVERDDGLVPWEYGSVASMDIAGNQRVSQGVTYMQVGEMGSVTIPGYPQLPLGAELRFDGLSVLENRSITSNNQRDLSGIRITEKGKWDATQGSAPSSNPKNGDYYIISKSGSTDLNGINSWAENNLVVFKNGRWEQQLNPQTVFLTLNGLGWFGTFGPNITGITVDIGEQGLQSTYTMRTYTPKFGRFSKRNSDRLQEYSQIINSVKKQARLIAVNEFKIQSNRKHSAERLFSNRLGNPFSAFAASPPAVLTGQIVDIASNTKKSTAVQLIKHNELLSETEKYSTKAMMSLDGILRPVSKSGSGGLPRFVAGGTGGLARGYAEFQPPSTSSYTPVNINKSVLDPWQTGHDIDILARGTEIPNNLSIPLDDYNYTSDYRGLALKGPLLLQQFGYDTNGKPVPNSVDSETLASGGTFQSYSLTDDFLDDYIGKPHTWPVAPVDLRLDRKRGVWVSPPMPKQIVTARITQEITYRNISTGDPTDLDPNDPFNSNIGKFGYGIIIGEDIVGADGSSVQNPQITIWDDYLDSDMKLIWNLQPNDLVLVYSKGAGSSYGIIRQLGRTSSNVMKIYKAVNTSQVNTGKPYDEVEAVLCVDLDGEEYRDGNDQFTYSTVKLMKHHIGTAELDSNYNSAIHMHDVRPGDILICSEVSETGGTRSVVAVSDYSREHSIFYGLALTDSKGPGFPDFTVRIRTPDNDVPNAEFEFNPPLTVVNKLRQPILAGDCCYVYRHKALNGSIEPEFWLMQGVFTPVCVISDIAIGTQGGNTAGGEIANATNGAGYGFSFPAYSKYLTFHIRDITLYSEAAYKTNNGYYEGNTYMGMVLDTDVTSQCCSNGTRPATVASAYQIDINAFLVYNTCNTSEWTHSDVNATQCDPTTVHYFE